MFTGKPSEVLSTSVSGKATELYNVSIISSQGSEFFMEQLWNLLQISQIQQIWLLWELFLLAAFGSLFRRHNFSVSLKGQRSRADFRKGWTSSLEMEGLSHTLIAWGSYCHDPQRLSALSIANIKKKNLSRYERFRSYFLGCLCPSWGRAGPCAEQLSLLNWSFTWI